MERPFSNQELAVRMFEMLHVPVGSWVNNFPLQGRLHPESGRIVGLVGYFPIRAGHMFALFDLQENQEPSLRSRVLSLRVPEGIKGLVAENPALYKEAKNQAESLGLPTIVIVFARSGIADEEYIGIYVAIGKSPQTALATIQDCIQKEKARLN